MLFYCDYIYLDGQNCINNPNISRAGHFVFPEGIQIIMPSLNFTCNGRISGVTANVSVLWESGSLPVFQVWHPLSPGSNIYSKIGEVQFETEARVSSYFISVSLTSLRNNQIEFQSGDVIGCYQPFNSPYRILWISDASYTVYFNSVSNSTDTVNSVNYRTRIWQPLISVMTGE